MKTGIELITEERKRQIEVEGCTPEHDNKHTDGELAAAASVYADFANYHGEFNLVDGSGKAAVLIPRDFKWPWGKAWWKPTPENRVKELTKAGALIAAEIDRLNRLGGQLRQENANDPISDVADHIDSSPKGLMPKKHFVEQITAERLNEVRGAIARYYDAGMKIDIEWIEEYNQLIETRGCK